MNDNPYAPPTAEITDVGPPGDRVYAGFWIRTAAALIDTVLILAVTMPLLGVIYGWNHFSQPTGGPVAGIADALISYVLPAVAAIAFWLARQATPGKMVLGLQVIDLETGGKLSVGQAIGRYLSYYLSTLVFMLGFIWVAFDARKQGWHDKLAGTAVVRRRR